MIKDETVIEGVPISSGIVMGTARVVTPGEAQVAEVPIPASRVPREIEALETAVEQTLGDLREMHQSAIRKVGGPVAKIFDAQILIAGDYEFLKKVKAEIGNRRLNAGYVYHTLVQEAVIPLKSSPDHYMRQMAIDIESVANKVLARLAGRQKQSKRFPPNTIMVGKVFSPNDVLSYRERRAVGFVVSEGGTDSHMALISRALLLPVVLAEGTWQEIQNDQRLIVDGSVGKVIVNPTDATWAEYQKRKRRLGPTMITRIKKLPVMPPVTADDHPVPVGANLTLPGPADEILADRKIPVGLYRTEFLYLASGKFPDEESQYDYYRRILELFAPTPVVLRAFDLGGDKLGTDANWPPEDNPALGLRGIRAMLAMPRIFKTQIRAMLRASVHGNLKIMLPMISELEEVERARKILSQEKFKLRREKIPFDENVELGIMIEVPSAAMTADVLSKRVDFVSIGTNDLAQYTLAADRMNNRVAHLYNPLHPSVLHLVNETVKACKRNKVPVSICGELAGVSLAVPLLIGMQIDLLSMAPGRIVDVCRLIKKIDSTLVRHLVGPVMACSTLQAVVECLRDYKTALEQR